MSWSEIIPSISESVGKLFSIIDKAVPDVTERDKLKVELLKGVMGTGSQHWLQANAFSIAMLCTYFLAVALTVLDRNVPEWVLVIVLSWTAGPLLHGFTRETKESINEIAKRNQKQEEKK
jgi:hypothetical protein